MSSIKTQDMPPSGGYAKIKYARVPAKSYFTGFQMIAGYFIVTTAGLYVYHLTAKKIKREEIEMRSCQNVIFPIMVAERDREFLKQLRRNRDEEAELMKNVKGWEVGTWYGEPIYKNIPRDTLISPSFNEFYCHANPDAAAERANIKLWT